MRVWTLWKLAGAAMAAIVLVAGTYQAVGALAHAESTTSQRLDAAGITAVEVHNSAGPVRVLGVEGSDRIVVRARISDSLRSTEHAVTRRGDRLVVRGSCPLFGGEWCSVGYTLEVPASLDLVVVRADGGIELSDLDGDVDVSTDQGRVALERIGGDVRADTDQGRVTGTRLAGATVRAGSDQGRVALAFSESPRRVDAHSDQGSVEIVLPDDEGVAYVTDTGTDQGTVTDPIRQDPGSDRTIRAHSDQGDVTVRYAGG